MAGGETPCSEARLCSRNLSVPTLPSDCAPTGLAAEARNAPWSTASGSPPCRAGVQHEVVDEVAQLRHALRLIDDLLIQPEPPGQITTLRLLMKSLHACCIRRDVQFISREPVLDDILGLTT